MGAGGIIDYSLDAAESFLEANRFSASPEILRTL
jgi:hypothetical protein